MTGREKRAEFHVPVTGEITALEQLCISTGFSKQKIKEIMQKGAVWVTAGRQVSRVRRATKVLAAGMTVHLYYHEKVLSEKPAGALLIADMAAYSVWYKPYGMYSQGTRWGDHCTVYRWAGKILNRPVFTVHRLDRAASGLIIISHRKATTRAFTEIFEQRTIQKIYRVIVHGRFPEDPETVTISIDIDGRKALSRVTRLKYHPEKNRSLLSVLIETGRKHQIRRHLAVSGFPVVGDRLYGERKDTEDLQLSAHHMAFICPRDRVNKVFTLPDELAITEI